MKHINIIKFYLSIILFSIDFSSKGQIITIEKLLGCWKTNKLEFLKSAEDSTQLITSVHNYISCFDQKGKFNTRLLTKNGENFLGSGTYTIDQDGKTIYQKRDIKDNGVDSVGEVTILNDRELVIKVEDVIIHLTKIKNENN